MLKTPASRREFKIFVQSGFEGSTAIRERAKRRTIGRDVHGARHAETSRRAIDIANEE